MNFDRCASFCSLHRPQDALATSPVTLRVPRFRNILYKIKRIPKGIRFNLAGAEGLEPSARGFGDRCSTN